MNVKYTVMLCLGLLVCALSAINLILESEAAPTAVFELYGDGDEYIATDENDSYFENARYTRKQSRDEAVSVLNGIINNSNLDSSAKNNAAAEISGYANRANAEQQIENRILAKGFEDCVVFVSKETCSIVVKTEGLDSKDATQIMSIAVSETGFKANVIKIIELK